MRFGGVIISLMLIGGGAFPVRGADSSAEASVLMKPDEIDRFLSAQPEGSLIELSLTQGSMVKGKLLRYDEDAERVWVEIPEKGFGSHQRSIRLKSILSSRALTSTSNTAAPSFSTPHSKTPAKNEPSSSFDASYKLINPDDFK